MATVQADQLLDLGSEDAVPVAALHDPHRAAELADLAEAALRTEVLLAPKPGLVDPLTSGAHDDMDVDTFLASIAAIRQFFPVFHETGRAGHQDGRLVFIDRLRGPGLACEEAMFAATDGVNTHKGAVFAFGLLLGCCGRLSAGGVPVTVPTLGHLCSRMAGGIVSSELHTLHEAETYGERAYIRHGMSGARGEAASGYRSVRELSLPAYHDVLARTGDERLALLQSLLVLMARTEDTTLVKDGSRRGVEHVQRTTRSWLRAGGVDQPDALRRLRQMDIDFATRRLSPGGCADLLAVTYFFVHLSEAV